MTELEVEFVEETTVGEVNALLSALDGRITFLIKEVPIVLVHIPNPGSVANLDAVVAQIESDPAVRYVRRGYFAAPRAIPHNHADLANVDKIDHHLAVRAFGAWNVRQLLNAASPPRLVVADTFGGGPPLANYDVVADSADFGNFSTLLTHG